MTKTFCQRVIESCESHSKNVAMRIVGDDSATVTFGEMLRQTRSIAYRLEQEKIEFGDRVALIGENHPSWEIAYLGTLFRGAVSVPIDPHGEIETITNFLENSEAKLAFISPDFAETFQQIEEKLGRHIPAVVWQMENSTNGFQKFEDWSETEFPAEFTNRETPAKNEDSALLMYTSGTTGTPKGVPLTHGNIIAELDGIYEVLKLTDQDRILSLLPLFHVYLQIVNLWVATTYAIEVGYLKELNPAELGDAMKSFKPTILTTVPRLWYLFHKKIFDTIKSQSAPVRLIFNTMFKTNGFLRDNFKANLGEKFFKKVHDSFGGELRFAITAGSRFDEAVAADFYKLGFTIIQGYGLTETSGAASATYEKDNRVGSVGKPFVNAEFKLDKPNKEGIGEVLIKGGMVFKGYYKNEQATKEVFTGDGFFRTGDLGKFDKDGQLYIVGRSKDVIVLPNGKNIHPEDLETHYLKTPTVEELAIIGVKDEGARAGAEKLIAVVVPDFAYLKQNNVSNSKEAVRYDLDNLGRSLPEYQRVREYIVTDQPIPRTSTKKIKRFELQKQIESGELSADKKLEKKVLQLSAEDAKLLESSVGRAVVSVLQKNAETAEKIHPSQSLELDLGLDSLSRAEVFAGLEQAFNTEFAGEEAAKALTVRDVIDLTKAHAGNVDENAEISTDFNWAKIVKDKSEDIPEVKYVLRDRLVFPAIAFTVYKAFKLFNRFFMSLEVENEKVFDKMQRPFIICPNHQSFLDPFIITANYPFGIYKHIFHVGASMFFKSSFMQWVAQMLNVVPVDPDTQLMKAMKASAIGLKHGKVLNIYPEGERAFDGELSNFKKGAAILSTELDLPILPVAIDGVYKVWARKSWIIRPAKVKVRFGEPFYPKDILSRKSENENLGSAEENEISTDERKYEIVTEHLKSEIEKMIAEMRK